MKSSVSLVFLAAMCVVFPQLAGAQGMGSRGMIEGGRYGPPAPKMPGVELTGPLDTALARTVLNLSDSQAARYAQSYDSFMVATRLQRDSATAAIARRRCSTSSAFRTSARI